MGSCIYADADKKVRLGQRAWVGNERIVDRTGEVMRLLIITIALLAGLVLAHAADELPASGAAVVMKPTSTGYEGQIVIPRGKYMDARASSTDPMIAGILDFRIDRDEQELAPQTGSPGQQPVQSLPTGSPSPSRSSFVRLVTVVLKSGAVRQGQYPLTLRLAAATPETRDLSIVLPAARIEPIETMVVLRDIGGGSTTANQPQIWETTQRGWLTNITLAQRGNTDAGAEPAGRIQPKGRITDITPGGNRLIELGRDYELVGDFPLGTAKGKLVLAADQLADQASFSFEIRSRLWLPWIFAPMLAGLFLGRAARTWLAGRINLQSEKEKTYTLLAMIDSALARNADPEFVSAATAAQDTARDATGRATVEDVRSATADAQRAYEAAVAALTARRTELDKAVSEFRALVVTPYRSPAALTDALAAARDSLEAGLDGIASNNIARAAQALAGFRSQIHHTAAVATRSWINAAVRLDPIVASLAPIAGADATADVGTHLKAAREAVLPPLVQVENAPAASIELIKSVLDALHAGTYALQNLLAHFSAVLGVQLTRYARVVANAPLRDEGAWNAWIGAARRLAAAMHEFPPTDSEPAIERLEVSASDLVTQLRGALVAQLKERTEADQIDALLRDGNTAAAIAKLAELLRQSQEEPEPAVKGKMALVASAAQAIPDVIMPGFLMAQTQSPAVAYGYTEPPRETVSPLALLAAANRGQIATSGWLLSLIYAGVIVIGGYFLFADKWIGTPIDFASVFFWAFAIDIGADAAVTAAKAVKTRG